MNTFKLILAFVTGIFLTSAVCAQGDMARMEKDIDVFEKVINQLFKQDDHFMAYHYNNNIANGTYVPGFGVIVQLPGSHGEFYYPGHPSSFNMDVGKALEESRKAIREADIRIEEANKEIKKEKKKVRIYTLVPQPPAPPDPPAPPMQLRKNIQIRVYDNDKRDSIPFKKQQFILSKMKEALQNYSDLITRLAPGEKILMVYDEQALSGNGNSFFYSYNGKEMKFPKISAEVKKEDIDAYRSGKINSKAFGERLKTTVQEDPGENLMDYKVFSGILETVLNNSSDLHVRNNINFTVLPDFGVIYHASLYSPYASGPFPFSGDDGEDGDAKKDDKEDMGKMTETVKNNLLDYGRTVRNLKNEQYIMLNLQVPHNNKGSKTFSFKIRKEVLVRYDKGELSRDKALAEINVSE